MARCSYGPSDDGAVMARCSYGPIDDGAVMARCSYGPIDDGAVMDPLKIYYYYEPTFVIMMSMTTW